MSSRRDRTERALTVLWLLNAAAFVGAALWVAIDPAVGLLLVAVEGYLRPTADDALVRGHFDYDRTRTTAAAAIAVFASASIATLGVALVFGPVRHRRLRSWLLLTALVAGWLGLGVAWREFSWAGQRWRIARQVDVFETVAAPLRKTWPTEDGKMDGLGQFMAYPVGRPRMLMMLMATPSTNRAPIAAVERSSAGGLRFQLAGAETGAWLEWHPPGEAPRSFVGGLDAEFELARVSQLGDGWFMTSYRTTNAQTPLPPP